MIRDFCGLKIVEDKMLLDHQFLLSSNHRIVAIGNLKTGKIHHLSNGIDANSYDSIIVNQNNIEKLKESKCQAF